MKLIRIVALWPLILLAQQPEAAPPKARFHHVALNVTDPKAAIEFLTKRFDCEPAKLDNKEDAVWAQKSWILFNKVATPPNYEIVSSIWHIGWGAEDMKATYQKQLDMGTPFQTPLTDISKLANFNGFFLRLRRRPQSRLDRDQHRPAPSLRPYALLKRRPNRRWPVVRRTLRSARPQGLPRQAGTTKDSRSAPQRRS